MSLLRKRLHNGAIENLDTSEPIIWTWSVLVSKKETQTEQGLKTSRTCREQLQLTRAENVTYRNFICSYYDKWLNAKQNVENMILVFLS